VRAYEGEKDLVQALLHGWRHGTGLKDVKAEARDLFKNPLIPEELRKADTIVIDPPRAGAAAQIAEIAGSALPRMTYVSCNPQTFARDAAHLVAAGFRLNWVQPIDQFRWSPHIELVADFDR
jgi:23S rRNA (uracil1939-C5)-methyltransferase